MFLTLILDPTFWIVLGVAALVFLLTRKDKLRTIAQALFGQRIYETIFEPTIRDVEYEYLEAISCYRRHAGRLLLWKVRWIRFRGYWSFWSAVFAQTPVSLLECVFKLCRHPALETMNYRKLLSTIALATIGLSIYFENTREPKIFNNEDNFEIANPGEKGDLNIDRKQLPASQLSTEAKLDPETQSEISSVLGSEVAEQILHEPLSPVATAQSAAQETTLDHQEKSIKVLETLREGQEMQLEVPKAVLTENNLTAEPVQFAVTNNFQFEIYLHNIPRQVGLKDPADDIDKLQEEINNPQMVHAATGLSSVAQKDGAMRAGVRSGILVHPDFQEQFDKLRAENGCLGI